MDVFNQRLDGGGLVDIIRTVLYRDNSQNFGRKADCWQEDILEVIQCGTLLTTLIGQADGELVAHIFAAQGQDAAGAGILVFV